MKQLFCLLMVVSFVIVSCEKDSESDDNTVKDIVGNVYQTVKIGTQVWMVENLKTNRYNDSTLIPMISDDADWAELISAGLCWYDNDGIGNKEPYGALYNWYAVNSGKLAPDGWHVATDEDWSILTTFLGGNDIAGGKLKEKGTGLWQAPNTGATNESDFTAVPGGFRRPDGEFVEIGHSANWWTTTNFNADNAYFRGIGYSSGQISRNNYDKNYGFSVRCVKD